MTSKELQAFQEIKNKLLTTEKTESGGTTTYGSIHDAVNLNIIEDAVKAYLILKRYIANVSEYPGNEQSPYWICFAGFEGENGDLSKEEYEFLKRLLKHE